VISFRIARIVRRIARRGSESETFEPPLVFSALTGGANRGRSGSPPGVGLWKTCSKRSNRTFSQVGATSAVASVAARVFGPGVCPAVGCVAQIPRGVGGDGLQAFRTDDWIAAVD